MNDGSQNMTGKKHYGQIDALKGMAIFLVVLGHSIIIYPVNLYENEICNFIVRCISSVHMPLFFIVSGFCFSFSGNYKTYIWKKIKRLMIPYLFFNVVDIVPRCLLADLVNRSRGMGESLKEIVFYGGEYWFLYTLFIIFLVYPLIDKAIHKNRYKAIIAMIILLGLHYGMPSISVFTVSRVIDYSFFFMLGAVIKQYLGNPLFEINFNKRKTLVVIIVLFAGWMSLVRLQISYLSVVIALIGIIICYLCMQFEIVIGAFQDFGKYSLQLYLLNGYLLVISRTIIVTVLGVTNPLVIIVFNMLVDFVLSYMIIIYVCEKIGIVKVLMGMQRSD